VRGRGGSGLAAAGWVGWAKSARRGGLGRGDRAGPRLALAAVGLKRKKTYELEGKGFEQLKRNKQLNSNLNLNSNNQKQCTSMNATINSYNSFILF
jgi:hypothetical protein